MPAIQPIVTNNTAPSRESLANVSALFRGEETANTPATTDTSPSPEVIAQGDSPLQAQYREPHSTGYDPIQLIFISGKNKGQFIDLGLSINEHSQSQSASWSEDGAKGIVQGLNFDHIAPREFRFTVEFFDLNENIIHLVESLTYTVNIEEDTKQPPFLMLSIGAVNIDPVVCTSMSPTYDTPIRSPQPNARKGYRHCKVELSFKLVGGKDSKHIFSQPLAATALGDRLATLTAEEAQQEGTEAVVELLLADCLGQEGSNALTALIDGGGLSDVNAVVSLPNDAFIQAAIGGFFDADLLAQDAIQSKIRIALADQMAATTNGIFPPEQEAFSSAIQTGNDAGLSDRQITEVQRLRPHYLEITDAITRQDFSGLQDIANPASNTLNTLGSCGISMRQVGVVDVAAAREGPDADGITLVEITDFLGAEPSDEDIKGRFGDFLTDQEIEVLKNGHPYQSKVDFVEHISQNGLAISGYSLWSQFVSSGDNNEADETIPTPEP